MKIQGITRTLLVVAALGAATASFAQDQTQQQPGMGPRMMGQGAMMGGQPMGPGQGMIMMMGGQPMMGGCPVMGMGPEGAAESFIEGRLAFLKTEIGIKESQAKAWNAFADAMRANAKSMVDMRNQMMTQMGQGMASTTQMLDTRIAMMESRLEAMKKLKPATDKLYQTLSPEQRAKADQLLPGVGCMM